ncbi:ankyrin repeat domain-containing protein [Aspergillus chevalieri]|uniref:Ankyrin repeat protein n=1 Tax=Aspergillus chevalieri TaxID=182096 RepID=A0A7R7VH60_ASPCH|nr:uncharacterized protein ACHE_20100A [Aspergillus chevalieri]BCR84642.1 hypothetical protein ACHE_20100A [Aspergillus chevalieri]
MKAKDEQLFQAASTGNLSTISSILAEYSPPPETLQQTIVKAIYPNANLSVVTELLHRQFPDLPLSEDMIRWSCYTGSIPIAEAILAKDPQAYTGSFDDESGTPMVLAVQSRKSYEFLSYLLSHGADPFLHHGRYAPLFPAAVLRYHGGLDAVAAMMDHGVNLQHQNILLGAVSHGYLELARYLLAHGVTPENDQSMDNQSKVPVLHIAVSNGDIRMVQLLLEYGARVDVKDDQGLTTVQVAEKMQHSKIIELLKASLC